METHSKDTDVGKYYKTQYGGAQISIPKTLAERLPFKHSDKLMIHRLKGRIIVTPLRGGVS